MTYGRIVLLTGLCGAGKSTLARALAQRRERAVVIPIDDLRDFVVSGCADPTAEWTEETRLQFRLAHRNAARMAADYADAGFDVFLDQLTFPEAVREEIEPYLAPHLLKVLLLMPSVSVAQARNATRTKNDPALIGVLHGYIPWLREAWEPHLDGLPANWIRLDTSGETLAQSVDRIEASLAEAL
ncbi:phosphotransferase [bacterium]|nr:MAG: phosphotransferase [bacterium]